MNHYKGIGEEDDFECLFESALEEERSLSKTLSLPRTSISSSNACSGVSSMSLSSSKSGLGVHESGETSMDVEETRDPMQDDWRRLLQRIRGPIVQQARASVGCVQANQTKLAGEDVRNVKSHSKQDNSGSIRNSPRSKTTD